MATRGLCSRESQRNTNLAEEDEKSSIETNLSVAITKGELLRASRLVVSSDVWVQALMDRRLKKGPTADEEAMCLS